MGSVGLFDARFNGVLEIIKISVVLGIQSLKPLILGALRLREDEDGDSARIQAQ
jgi:hypothetical protein